MADPNESWMSDYIQQDHPINGFKPWEDRETPQNNIFYHHGKYWVDDRIMVLESRITEVISGSHDAVTAGHWGSRKALQMLQRKYIFNDMKEHVDHHVKTCNVCQRVKSERKRARGRIQFLDISQQKWHVVHMDWVLGLPPWPPNVGTYDAMLTFTDEATKMVHFVATNRFEKATDTARCFMHYIVRCHGLPRTVICDRDARFLSFGKP